MAEPASAPPAAAHGAPLAAPPAPLPAAPPARGRPSWRRTIRALGLILFAIDMSSLSLLLGKLGLTWYLAIALGVVVGGVTTYESQWRFLLSREAYRRLAHPLRYALVALVVLVLNVAGFYLVARAWFFTYLFTRLLSAAMVLASWTAEIRQGNRRAPR